MIFYNKLWSGLKCIFTLWRNILYLAKSMWTPAQHTHMWSFPETLQAHNCIESLCKYYNFPSMERRDTNMFQHYNEMF